MFTFVDTPLRSVTVTVMPTSVAFTFSAPVMAARASLAALLALVVARFAPSRALAVSVFSVFRSDTALLMGRIMFFIEVCTHSCVSGRMPGMVSTRRFSSVSSCWVSSCTMPSPKAEPYISSYSVIISMTSCLVSCSAIVVFFLSAQSYFRPKINWDNGGFISGTPTPRRL